MGVGFHTLERKRQHINGMLQISPAPGTHKETGKIKGVNGVPSC